MNANDIITITLSAEDWALLRAIAKKDAEQTQTQTEESASLTPEEGRSMVVVFWKNWRGELEEVYCANMKIAEQECEKLAHVGIHAEIEEEPLFSNPYVEP